MDNEAMAGMNPVPLDDSQRIQANRHWVCELAEAVAMISVDQEQRHVAWRTLARLMVGRSDLKRIFVVYIFILQLLNSATRMGTVSLAGFIQGEFMGGNPLSWMHNLTEARDRAIARIGRKGVF